MVLTVVDPADTVAVRNAIERTGVAQELTVTGTTVGARVKGGSTLLPGLLRDLDGGGVTVAAATVARPTLDDVFLTLTGRSLRDGASGAEPTDDVVDISTRPATRPTNDTTAHRVPATDLQEVPS
jgi:ABC-2 type transport system ATP-binding protein